MVGNVATFLLSERECNLLALVRITEVRWRMASFQFKFFTFFFHARNDSALVSLQHHLQLWKLREEGQE